MQWQKKALSMLENQAMRTASYSNSPNLGIIIFVHLYSEIVFLLIIISPFPQAYQVCGGGGIQSPQFVCGCV